MGAMLLFLTNFFAILVAGSVVLALLGSSAAATLDLSGHAKRRALMLIAVGTVIVIIPLAATSYNTDVAAQNQTHVTAAVKQWLENTDFQPVSTKLQSGTIKIQIEGKGDAPPTDVLINALQDYSKDETLVELEVIPSSTHTFTLPYDSQN